ncbi:MAG: VOC family protein [Anaerolineales bacterium]
MDFDEYRSKYFADPAPEPKYNFQGIRGAAVYYQDYQAALAYFEQVFGPPSYVEGEFTHGWRLGDTWLTVFPAKEGVPANVEVLLYLKDASNVDRLHAAMLAAGGQGEDPVDTLMYAPVRIAMITDPFGGVFTLVAER